MNTQYRMMGADGRTYGPAGGEQLRAWISGGRAAAHTLIQAEGSPEWRPLGTFPEFADAVVMHPVQPPPLMWADTRKSKLVAGLLGILLGSIGIHRFYLGYIGIGVAQILVTFVTCGMGALWGLIEGILILTGNTITTDAQGQSLKE